MDKSIIEHAPGFDKNNWPDMSDAAWGAQLSTYYRVRPYRESVRAEARSREVAALSLVRHFGWQDPPTRCKICLTVVGQSGDTFRAATVWERRGNGVLSLSQSPVQGGNDMPDKKTCASRAAGSRTKAGKYVREEMEHIRQGKHGARSTKQAIAD